MRKWWFLMGKWRFGGVFDIKMAFWGCFWYKNGGF
jgi:hypothetical protein